VGGAGGGRFRKEKAGRKIDAQGGDSTVPFKRKVTTITQLKRKETLKKGFQEVPGEKEFAGKRSQSSNRGANSREGEGSTGFWGGSWGSRSSKFKWRRYREGYSGGPERESNKRERTSRGEKKDKGKKLFTKTTEGKTLRKGWDYKISELLSKLDGLSELPPELYLDNCEVLWNLRGENTKTTPRNGGGVKNLDNSGEPYPGREEKTYFRVIRLSESCDLRERRASGGE